jgi:hypothetical protein
MNFAALSGVKSLNEVFPVSKVCAHQTAHQIAHQKRPPRTRGLYLACIDIALGRPVASPEWSFTARAVDLSRIEPGSMQTCPGSPSSQEL